jgi:uncharacterized protein YggE
MRTQSLVVLAALALVSHALAADQPMPRTITTSGDAVVNVVPDEVVLGLGVETFAPKLEDAKKQNDERSTKLVKVIKAAGVEEKYIQTATLQLDIRYRSSRPSEGIEGYYARRSYSVTLKQPKNLEALLDSALNSGANQILGIDYRTAQLRTHRDHARQMAIKAAREKATALAAELDCTIGAPRTISEGHAGGYTPWMRMNSMAQNAVQEVGGAGAEGAEPTPFGQIGVTAQVSVTFDLMPK